MGRGGHQAKWEYFRAIYERYRKAGQVEAGDPGRILPERRLAVFTFAGSDLVSPQVMFARKL
ncbi:MAG: hypothetical protein DMG28_09190 [Acidobacteria bacterium]|nr:MAG: hypothetical protein DMG28_09190 [Acidobacteriota bacterium]